MADKAKKSRKSKTPNETLPQKGEIGEVQVTARIAAPDRIVRRSNARRKVNLFLLTSFPLA